MTEAKRTIAIVAPYFPPHGGGLERYAFEIGKRLAQNENWRIIVITSGERYGTDAREELEGMTVYRLSYRIKVSNTPFSLGWSKKIRAIFDSESPDLINVHMPVPGIGDVATMLKGKRPLVVSYHAGSMRKKKFLPDLAIALYERRPLHHLLAKADYIACASDFVRRNFLRGYSYKCMTITPAVDSALFTPSLQRRDHGNTVLFVAGLDRSQQHKGLKDLLHAVARAQDRVPGIRLDIVGDGNMREVYEAYAARLGIGARVTFKGRLEGEELARAYQDCDVMVLPSYAPAESFGMVLIEAMACGKPVIGSNMGGIPDVIDHEENGLLCEPGDPAGLADALARILLNKDFARRLGETGLREAREKYRWQAQTDAYDALFKAHLKKTPL